MITTITGQELLQGLTPEVQQELNARIAFAAAPQFIGTEPADLPETIEVVLEVCTGHEPDTDGTPSVDFMELHLLYIHCPTEGQFGRVSSTHYHPDGTYDTTDRWYQVSVRWDQEGWAPVYRDAMGHLGLWI